LGLLLLLLLRSLLLGERWRRIERKGCWLFGS